MLKPHVSTVVCSVAGFRIVCGYQGNWDYVHKSGTVCFASNYFVIKKNILMCV